MTTDPTHRQTIQPNRPDRSLWRMWWAGSACSAVTRSLWPRRAGGGGWFLIAPCLVWVLLWYALIAYMLAKAAVWLAVCALLALANVVTLAIGGLGLVAGSAYRAVTARAASHRAARIGGQS